MKSLSLSIGILLFAATGSAFAQGPYLPTAPRSSPNQLVGQLNILWADPVPGFPGEAQTSYYLVTDGGERWRLELEDARFEAERELAGLKGSRIQVTGSPASAKENTFRVQECRFLNSRDPVPPTGSQAYIWVLLKFSDDPDEPHLPIWFVEQALGDYPSLDHYWREMSYNNLNLIGSWTTAWLELPHPRSHYIYEFDPDHEGEELDQGRTLEDGLLVSDPYVDFTGFEGINLCFNGELAGYAMGGWGQLTLDGETRDWGLTWLGKYGWGAHAVITHEIGHTLGLPHSATPYTAEYGSYWDLMSEKCGACTISDPEYGAVAIGTISYNKHRLGWIHPAHSYDMPYDPTVAAIHLNDLVVVPPTGRLLMGRVFQLSYPFRYYTVERRRWTGYDAGIPDETVVIHDVNTFDLVSPADVVDASNNGDPNDEGSRWDLGETFADHEYDVVIHVHDVTTSGSVVIMSNSAREHTYVASPAGGYQDGSSAYPWDTVFEGYGAAYPEGTVWFNPDDYALAGGFTFRKPVTLSRWGNTGEVTLYGTP